MTAPAQPGRLALPTDFFAREVTVVARELLGCVLEGRGAAGEIVEVEAYHQSEPAAHSYGGRATPRTQVMFGPPGHAYVYFTYGMHWCCNVSCEDEGTGAAVLFRALRPLAGVELMQERRAAGARAGAKPHRERDLCSGPAKLVQALGIGSADNGIPLAGPAARDVMVTAGERAVPLPDDAVVAGPRIGISQAVDLPWRFCVARSPWLSRPA